MLYICVRVDTQLHTWEGGGDQLTRHSSYPLLFTSQRQDIKAAPYIQLLASAQKSAM